MSTEDLYKAALAYVQKGTPGNDGAELSNMQKLEFYGLYKQIVSGPCNTKAPSKLKMVEYAKWQAWNKLGKINKEEAMKQYAGALSKADPKWQERAAKAGIAVPVKSSL